jgi:hypothetical protein
MEPAYQTGMRDVSDPRGDDYNCDLPAAGRDSLAFPD